MRVHVVTPFFLPVTGGQETRIDELTRRLAARGHEVHVHTTSVTPDGAALPREERLGEVAVHRYAPHFRLGYFLQSWKPRIEATSETVVEAQGYPHLTGDATERAYGAKMPFVMTPVGATVEFGSAAARALKAAYDVALGLPTMRRARRLILLTAAEKPWLEGHGVPTARARVVPGAASDRAFEAADPAPAKARHGLDEYVVLLGRQGVQKNPVQLVEALALLRDDFPRLQVALVGPDEGQGAAAVQRAQELGIAQRVVLTGRVAEEEKLSLLAGARALALPSLWEGMPLTIFEAWAQRVPVVASAVDGIVASVREGGTGVLAPRADAKAFAEALRRVLADPAFARRLGEQGRAEAERHHRWDAVAGKLEAVYKEALAEGPRR